MPVDQVSDNGISETAATPEASDNQKDVSDYVAESIKETSDKEPEQPQKATRTQEPKQEDFFLKNWKTKEAAVEGLTSLERKLHEQAAEIKRLSAAAAQPNKAEQPPATEADDRLTKEELIELMQRDPATYHDYMQAIMAEDLEKKLAQNLDGRLKPLEEVKKNLDTESFLKEQKAFEAETKKIMGEESYSKYDKLRQNPKFVQDVLESSTNGEIISELFSKGYQAQAMRLFYEQAEYLDLKRERQARGRSTKADVSLAENTKPKKLNPNMSTSDFVRESIRESEANN